MTTPAHDLARSRLMITEDDVDLIQFAVLGLSDVKDLTVYDLGAGSGTTAAAVLSVRRDHVHGTTLDISAENLDWSRKFVTNTWPDCVQIDDSFPVPCKFVTWNTPAVLQWRWINVPSIPPYQVRNRSVHFLMIDTSHDYEPTLEELTWWRKRMAPEHYVWLDDYTTYPGVKQAVDELVQEETLRIVEQRGQGVLCRYV